MKPPYLTFSLSLLLPPILATTALIQRLIHHFLSLTHFLPLSPPSSSPVSTGPPEWFCNTPIWPWLCCLVPQRFPISRGTVYPPCSPNTFETLKLVLVPKRLIVIIILLYIPFLLSGKPSLPVVHITVPKQPTHHLPYDKSGWSPKTTWSRTGCSFLRAVCCILCNLLVTAMIVTLPPPPRP